MSLLQLPEDSLEQIAFYLTAPDLLSFLTSSRSLNQNLGRQETFWKRLLENHVGGVADRSSAAVVASTTAGRTPKEAFLIQAHAKHLPLVRWYPLLMRPPWPSKREGHLCARLGDLIVLTGGFSGDESVYVKRIDQGLDWEKIPPVVLNKAAPGHPELPSFAYGATLTALDDSRAVRFGGFQSGGYSDEIAQVALLRIDRENRLATWQVQQTYLRSGRDPAHRAWKHYCARAYHTATLLYNRYLLILGGMQSDRSIWRPLLLDTQTWTWLDDSDLSGLLSDTASVDLPSARHGHSVIWDQFRQRVLLFGGGSGADLLRSGFDKSDVWFCNIPSPDEFDNAFRAHGSVVGFRWTCVHADQHQRGEAANDDESMTDDTNVNRLSTVEVLNLGRCHASFRVSRDTCLFVFGSGRPSTNGVLGYKLDCDSFFRVRVKGPLPQPRFTFAAVYIEEYAYLFVHGGFSSSTHYRSALEDGFVLDLATSLQRPMSLFQTNPKARSYPDVNEEDALLLRRPFQPQPSIQAQHQLIHLLMMSRGLLVPEAEAQNFGESDDSDDDFF